MVPDIWLNIILGESVRGFLDDINIWMGWLSKPGWVEGLNKTKSLDAPGRERELFRPDCHWAGTVVFFLPSSLN